MLVLFIVNVSFAQVTPENRLKIFKQVWETINDKYYDEKFNGVDWKNVKTIYQPKVETAKTDDEFYGVIKEMVRELKDAHTRFRTPTEAELRRKKQFSSIDLGVEEVDGKLVIKWVRAGSDEEKAGVKAGMIVTVIDGKNSSERMNELKQLLKSSSEQAVSALATRLLFSGDVGTIIKLSLVDINNKPLDVSLTRRIFNQSFDIVSQKFPNNIGYIKFNTFNGKMADKMKTAILGLKDTQGLIIDLRDNGGGELNFVKKIAGWLVDKKTSFGKMQRRSKEPNEIFVGSDKSQIYASPIAILIDKDSASGSELLSQGLQESNRVKVFGSTSCGCLLGIAGAKEIKDGELEFSQIGFISAKGKIVEGTGVVPDSIIDVQIPDFQTGNDRILNEAIKYLTKKNP